MNTTYFHTTFTRDLAGLNGKGRESCAKETVKHVEEAFYKDEILFEGDGAMKWKSSQNYLPEECAEAVAFIDISKANDTKKRYIFNASVEATKNRREVQNREFIESYRASHKNRVLSAEERYEMEAAFGKGTTVVDVITGQRFEL